MKIDIRHSKREDIDFVRAIYSGKDAVAGTLQLPFVAEHVWQERLEKPAPGVNSLVAEAEGKVLGHIALCVNQNRRRSHSAYIGMGVLDGYSGKGIGSALVAAVIEMADKWLNLSRLELTVFKDNSRAKRLYEKSGFVIEGEAKQFAFRNGVFVDALYMARVR